MGILVVIEHHKRKKLCFAMANCKDEGFSLCGCLFDASFDPSSSEGNDFFQVADNYSTSSGMRLEVASAKWGTQENSVDVTADVAAMIEADELTIPRGLKFSKIFGDPAKGKKKELVLVMRVDGETRDPLTLAEKRKEDYSIIA